MKKLWKWVDWKMTELYVSDNPIPYGLIMIAFMLAGSFVGTLLVHWLRALWP